MDIQDELGNTIWTSDTLGGIDRRPWIPETGYHKPMIYRYNIGQINNLSSQDILMSVVEKEEIAARIQEKKRAERKEKLIIIIGIWSVVLILILFFILTFLGKLFDRPIFWRYD